MDRPQCADWGETVDLRAADGVFAGSEANIWGSTCGGGGQIGEDARTISTAGRMVPIAGDAGRGFRRVKIIRKGDRQVWGTPAGPWTQLRKRIFGLRGCRRLRSSIEKARK